MSSERVIKVGHEDIRRADFEIERMVGDVELVIPSHDREVLVTCIREGHEIAAEYNAAVFEEMEQTGNGANVRLIKETGRRYFPDDATMFDFGATSTFDVLPQDITKEPLSGHYLFKAAALFHQSSYIGENGAAGIDLRWCRNFLDDSFVRWRTTRTLELEDMVSKGKFVLGSMLEVMGYAVREIERHGQFIRFD